MNKFIVVCLVLFSMLFLSGCAVDSALLDSGTDNVSTPCSTSMHTEPYWSNHYFDTGYGYHNMGYWGVGSWDIGSFRSHRAL
ncbi:MAG: hypothetical protein H0U75_11855 [Legionella sp.]|nr:hypothetical protein [Legionella sp.]